MPEFDSTIEYRPIQGFPAYMVGNDGSVWTCNVKGASRPRRGERGPWHQCSLHRRPYGAKYITISMRATPLGKVSCHYVHRLVLEAFVGQCPDGMESRHFPDRDTSNNRSDNLSWSTHQVNLADRVVHGTIKPYCPKGHPYTPENTYLSKAKGYRRCRACRREYFRKKTIAAGLIPRK